MNDLDRFTLPDLYSLHSGLCAGVRLAGDRMLDGDTPRIPVFSDEWNLLSAKQGELWEAAEAVLVEIGRREVDAARTFIAEQVHDA